MPDYTNLMGQRFGKLLVQKLSRFGAGGKVRVWECRCDCGRITEGWTQKLTDGAKTSCGCDDPRQFTRFNGRKPLTIERLREVMSYSPETGELRWRVSLGGKGRAGEIAGLIGFQGHRVTNIDGKGYRTCRLCWMHFHGEMPAGIIDHKNGVRDDDRIANLRLTDAAGNARNCRPKGTRPGHLKGAYTSNGRSWFSSICVDRRRIHLGTFASQREAHEAYAVAAHKYHGEFARVT